MLNFLNSDYMGGFVTALTLIGFAIAAIRWKKQQSSKISFTTKTAPIFVGNAPNGYVSSVSGNGRTGDSLFRTLVLISNRTQLTVTDDDFVMVPSIPLKEGGVLYEIRFIKGFNGSASMPEVYDDRVQLSDLVIPSNDAIAFEVLHDGSLLESLNAMPKSLPSVRNRSLSKSEGIDYSAAFVVGFGSIFLFDVPNRLDSLLNFPKEGSLAGFILFFLIFGAAIIIPLFITIKINQTGFPSKFFYRLWGYSISEATFSELKAEKQPLLHEHSRLAITSQTTKMPVNKRVRTKE